MNIVLTPELENLVNEKVADGLYDSAGEIVREALRLWQQQDELNRLRQEELRREILAGAEQLRQGKYKEYDSVEALIDDIRIRGQERLDAQRKGQK